MAVFGNITYHRLERLSMYVVIMPVNKIYTFISGKIIKGLLYRQPKLSPKFSDENQRPLYFLSIAIHKSLSYLMRVCDIILNYTRRVHVFIHSFQLMHCHCLWPLWAATYGSDRAKWRGISINPETSFRGFIKFLIWTYHATSVVKHHSANKTAGYESAKVGWLSR